MHYFSLSLNLKSNLEFPAKLCLRNMGRPDVMPRLLVKVYKGTLLINLLWKNIMNYKNV